MNQQDNPEEKQLKKSESQKMPVPFEVTPPPALREESYFPALTDQAVDISMFVDLLSQINLIPDEVLNHFDTYFKDKDWTLVQDVKTYQSFSPLKPLSNSAISNTVSEYSYTHYIEPVEDANSGMMALVCLLAIGLEQKEINIKDIERLLGQTESFSSQWHIDQHDFLKQKLQKGIDILRHLMFHPGLDTLRKHTQNPTDYTSLVFTLRVMGLTVFTHYTDIFKEIFPGLHEDEFNVDVLAELIDPYEGVFLHSVMGMLKACGVSCLCLANEGSGHIGKYLPHAEEGVEIFDQLGIYCSRGHYYLLMKLI